MTLRSDASVHNAYRAACPVGTKRSLSFFTRSDLWRPMAGGALFAHLAYRSGLFSVTHTPAKAIPHSSAHSCWCSVAMPPLLTSHNGARQRHTGTMIVTCSDDTTRGRAAAVDGLRGRRGRAAEGVCVNTQRLRCVAHGNTDERGR